MDSSVKWIYKPSADLAVVKLLVKELRIPVALAQLLVQREYYSPESVKSFYNAEFSESHDPFLMLGMAKAVDRLHQAIEKKENILIYGDYDVDGCTSVALMTSFLRQYNDHVEYYIPDRYGEGYGISIQGIEFARDNEFTLMIALDCGIRAVQQAEFAKREGVDMIICDHHLPGERVPEVVAVLDPKQMGCKYPYKELTGCGVGFKLLQAFLKSQGIPLSELEPWLDLVAISIACDIVPITGENRLFAQLGIQWLKADKRLGLRCLKEVAGLKGEPTITDIVFGIGPRINASGRMESATTAVDLLICDDVEEAKSLAKYIDELNVQRRALDETITFEAREMLENNDVPFSEYAQVLHKASWHKGVIGIVASRVIESHYKPTIMLSGTGDSVTGSARSVKGFDLYSALEKCKDILLKFGGHKYAAGLTIKETDLNKFREMFNQAVHEQMEGDVHEPQLLIDLDLSFGEINNRFYGMLKRMEPFGPSNMKPVFCSTKVMNAGGTRIIGKTKEHMRFELYQPDAPGITLNGIGFGLAEKYQKLKDPFSPLKIAYTLEENTWNGMTKLQLNVKDFEAQ